MNDYLMHHGVKGMKWGVRKRKPLSSRRQKKRDEIERRFNNKIQIHKDYLEYDKQLYNDSKKQLNDLLKNGKKSKTFKTESGDLYVDNYKGMVEDWKKWVADNEQNIQYGKEYIAKLENDKSKALKKYGG